MGSNNLDQSNSGVTGNIPQNWDQFMQELRTTGETLQGYTQKGFTPSGDQNQRLTDAYYTVEQCQQLFNVPEIQQAIQNHIQSGGSLSQGASASGARSGTQIPGTGVQT